MIIIIYERAFKKRVDQDDSSLVSYSRVSVSTCVLINAPESTN